MLYVFGVGEVPISISGDPAAPGRLVHTIRDVGTVSARARAPAAGRRRRRARAVRQRLAGRGGGGRDVVVVAGGLGLAPLRPAIYRLLAERERYGRVVLLYGTRSPDDILYPRELERWRRTPRRRGRGDRRPRRRATGTGTSAW